MTERFSNDKDRPTETTEPQELVKANEQSPELTPEQLAARKMIELLSKAHSVEIRPESEALENLLERHKAISFLTKFERQKKGEGFKVGEKVGAPFIITDSLRQEGGAYVVDKTKIRLLVDGIDVRQSDEFVISVTPEEYEAAQKFKGLTFNGVVEIASEGQYHISNMFAYDAKPIALESNLPINPDSVEKMKRGQTVIVEGKVVDFRITEYWKFTEQGKTEPNPKTAIIAIQTPDGRTIEVEIDPKVAYEQSSHLENISRKAPTIGDVVRINSTVKNKEPKEDDLRLEQGSPTIGSHGIEATQKSATKILTAPWCRSTYLLEPSPERQKEYDGLRELVGQKFTTLETALSTSSYEEARNVISQIIKEEVTEAERNKLNALAANMPEVERPLMTWNRYTANDVNKMFGVDIDRMTAQQFYEFSKRVVSMPFANEPSIAEGSHDYIYRVMEDINMPPERREEVMALATEARLEYFQDMDEKGQEYDHKKDWGDRYMAGQSLTYLGTLKTASATQKLVDLVHRIFTFTTGKSGVSKDELGLDAVRAMKNAYEYNAPDSEVVKILVKNIDKIREMEKSLTGEQMTGSEASDSNVVTLVPGGQDSSFSFQTSSAPQGRHNRSAEIQLEYLREVIEALDPISKKLEKGE